MSANTAVVRWRIAVCLLLFAHSAVIAEDPATLEALITRVRTMQESGATNQAIASYLAGVTDRRLSSNNRFSLAGNDFYTQLWDYPGGTRTGRLLENPSQRDRDWRQDDREVISQSAVTSKALWAWNNRVGNCNEAMSVTYYVLQQAGLLAQALEKPGHDYTVLGMAADANPNDPRTWGPNAVIVDGWTGEAVPAAQAVKNTRYVTANGEGVVFVSAGYNPRADTRYEEMDGKGIIRVFVKRQDEGVAVDGVSVAAGGVTATTGNGGRAVLTGVPAGVQVVSATPPGEAWLMPGSVSLTVASRRKYNATITLADAPVLPLTVVTWDRNGSVITDALVTVRNVGQARTGVNGAVFRVAPGTYEVSATKDGCQPAAQSVAVRRRTPASAFLHLVENAAQLTITSPVSGGTTPDSVVTVTGTSDRADVTTVAVQTNGVSRNVPVTAGRWSTRVTLRTGENVLVATAGGLQSQSVTVTLQPPAPERPPGPRGTVYRLRSVVVVPQKMYNTGEVFGQLYDLNDQPVDVMARGNSYTGSDHADHVSEGYCREVSDMQVACSVRPGGDETSIEFSRRITGNTTYVKPVDQWMNNTTTTDERVYLTVPAAFAIGQSIAYRARGSREEGGRKPRTLRRYRLVVSGWPGATGLMAIDYPTAVTSGGLDYGVVLNPAEYRGKTRYLPSVTGADFGRLPQFVTADHERCRTIENQMDVDPNATEYRVIVYAELTFTLVYRRSD